MVDLCFRESIPEINLNRLEKLGLLQQIHPSMHWNERCAKDYRKLVGVIPQESIGRISYRITVFLSKTSEKYLIWWSNYSPETISEICKRLQLSQISEKILQAYGLLNRKMSEMLRILAQ